MSRLFRNRLMAIVLGGLIVAAPIVTGGMASAGQIASADRQVTFAGSGLLAISCGSRPDVESLVVPADSTVRVVNDTGVSARLLLGGETKATLPDDASTDVVFRRGTTAVQLKPNCPITESATPVLVTASPSPSPSSPDLPGLPSMPGGIPIPAGSEPPSSPTSASPSAEPSGNPSSSPVSPPPHKTRPPATHRPTTQSPTPDPTSASPRHRRAQVKSTPSGTPGSTAPAYAGTPADDQGAPPPAVPPQEPTPIGQDPRTAAGTDPPAEIAAAEPVAASLPDSAPLGMLGLTAAVCVVGVGAAAIRAIVSQRANRANLA